MEVDGPLGTGSVCVRFPCRALSRRCHSNSDSWIYCLLTQILVAYGKPLFRCASVPEVTVPKPPSMSSPPWLMMSLHKVPKLETQGSHLTLPSILSLHLTGTLLVPFIKCLLKVIPIPTAIFLAQWQQGALEKFGISILGLTPSGVTH